MTLVGLSVQLFVVSEILIILTGVGVQLILRELREIKRKLNGK